MINIDLIGAVVFVLLASVFLFLKRKNLDIQGKFPFVYMIMLRTKLGINLMDRAAKKLSKAVRIVSVILLVLLLSLFVWKFEFLLGIRAIITFIVLAGVLIYLIINPKDNFPRLVITTGFIGMVAVVFSIVWSFIRTLTTPEAAEGIQLVLPIPAKGVFYVPFTYWIVSIFLLALVHEFAHGLIARFYNLKVKSSGFAFFSLLVPIIPAAFVEPEEEDLKKRPAKEQLAVYAAGPFSNIIFAFVFFIIAALITSPLTGAVVEYDGQRLVEVLEYENYTTSLELAGVPENITINTIDEESITDRASLLLYLYNTTPGQNITLRTENGDYEVMLIGHPSNESRSFLGGSFETSYHLKGNQYVSKFILWFIGKPDAVSFTEKGLLFWLYLLNIGVGLFNLAPLGPVDGGRMLLAVLQKKKNGLKIWSMISWVFLAMIVSMLLMGFLS